jgi:hypothetical protein
MKIFFANGRLGNQIFQYVFLKTIQTNNEKIIVSGFEELKEVFKIDDIINLNTKNRWIRGFLFRVCKPLLYFLADKAIISSVSVNHEKALEKYRRESATFSKSKGYVDFVTFIKPGYFQSEMFFDKEIVEKLKIKDKYLKEADVFLNSIPDNANKIFIHIRRDDYKNFIIYGKSTLLPMNYYKEQIKWFLDNRKYCFFIFLSDETEFIRKEFDYVKNKLISTDNSFGTDLTIMTKCNSAILSPSSFGWWGSYLMENRDVVFAPKYWLGFNAGIEFHKGSVPSYSKEKDIK